MQSKVAVAGALYLNVLELRHNHLDRLNLLDLED